MKTTQFIAHFDTEAAAIQDQARCHPWWLYANLLSLDAPIVAVVWLGAFSRAFDSPVAWSVYAVLFLAVWSIYVADRLLDGLRQKNWSLATGRHRFVRRHQKGFVGLLAVILSLGAVITLEALPADLILAGFILCLLVVLYFTAFVRLFPQLKPLRAKEFACGLVFALGTALGVNAVRSGVFNEPEKYLTPILLFAALCIYNCLIIAARERCEDRANDPVAASVWWKQLDRDLTVLGVVLLMGGGIAWLLSGQSYLYPACLLSALALVSVHFFQGRFSDSLSRVLADVTLLGPLLLLI
ncbi:MAG: hypothetical protein GXP30_14030 [Verrucomicrobia bacterium]|nr:hypothetical protein [Verrucomicrobiota bacterium]